MGGDATMETLVEVKGDTGKGAHPTARRTLVSGNQASTIRVGYTFDSYNTGLDATYPASNTSLIGNQGNLQLLKHTGTTQSGGPLQTDGVRRLSPADVGPAALAGASGTRRGQRRRGGQPA